MNLSIVVPIFNEEDNLRALHQALVAVLSRLDRSYEIIFVDDGSDDGSLSELQTLAARDGAVRVIEFRRNFGQTAALSAGIEAARGDVIVTLDGDLQNDPADIPLLLEKIDEGYDLVHGWRKDRQDPFLSRRLPSHVANWLIARVTGIPVHDLGCTLKAVRRDVARELELYGEMHRFIPVLAHQRGARCAEVVTTHHARRRGTSKYGLSRLPRVLFDLLTVKYLIQFLISPMKLFGAIGLGCGVAGILSGIATVWMKLESGTDMTGNPLLLLSVLFLIVSAQFIGMGTLGELGTRIYYQNRHRRPYAIRRRINFETDRDAPTVKQETPQRHAA